MSNFISELEKQYFEELKEFYSPYFPTLEEVDVFINKAIQLDWDDRRPRQMLFQVQRFVSLATEIDKIRPERDGLRMLFLKCCMESLANLSNKKNKEFYKCFATFFSEEGKHYILDNFSLSFIEHSKNGLTIHEGGNLDIADILSIIKAMRDMVVHEGNYWELQLFAYDKDSTWLTHIETNKQLLSQATYNNNSKESVTYHFETTLQYEMFVHYFVEACKNYIANYIEIRLKEKNF